MSLHFRRAALMVAATMLVIAPLAAGSASAATPPDPIPRCLPHGIIPANINLTVADDGRTLCVYPGQHLTVTLSVDPDQFPNPANWWTAITATGAAVQALPNPELPMRGTTIAHFVAVDYGQSMLLSMQRPCPVAADAAEASSGPLTCLVIRSWRVTVNVGSATGDGISPA